MTAPRPWSAATSPRGRRCRCTRRPRRSPRTTGSSSTCSPPTARPGRAGSSGRSRSCATTSWPAAGSARWPSWTGRSRSGCRSAAGSVHRTHGERHRRPRRARSRRAGPAARAAATWSPSRHLRRVGRDCLISFEGSHYSVPARAGDGRPARAGQRVEVRVSADTVTIHRLAVDGPTPLVLAAHTRRAQPRAADRRPRALGGAARRTHPRGHPRSAHPTRRRPAGRSGDARPAGRAAVQPEPRPGSTSRTGRWPTTTSLAGLAAPAPAPPPRRQRRPPLRWPVRHERAGHHPDPRPRHPAGLPHLAEHLDRSSTAPRPTPWATSSSSTCCSARNSGCARDAGSAPRSSCPGCRTTRPSTSSTSPSNPTSTPARSATWPPWSSSPPRSNIALLGPPGVGKTHLAVALAVAACQAGYSIYFTSLDDAVRQLRAAEAAGRFAKKLQTYLRPAVLVLDEVGYLPCDRAAANMVFQLDQPPLRTRHRSSSPATRPSPNGAASSPTTSWPPPSSTGSCTTATSSPSTAPATGSKTALLAPTGAAMP